MAAVWENSLWSMATAPLGWLYGACMGMRRSLYGAGLLRSSGFDVPVISVGNLTVGGVGKTPFVDLILGELPQQVRPVMVLARGYGGRFAKDGCTLNDEGHMLRLRHPACLVVQGADRAAAAREAMGHTMPGAIILDDGAQHLQIRRDLEIILVDARSLQRPVRVLPSGPWRESPTALEHADVVVLTHADSVSDTEREAAVERIAGLSPSADIFTAIHRPVDHVVLGGETRESLESLCGLRVGIVCSIASPQSFADTVAGIGSEVAWTLAFGDHHHYSPGDLATIAERVRQEPVDLVLTTEKDAPKLDDAEFDVRVLRVEIDLKDGMEGFRQRLLGVL